MQGVLADTDMNWMSNVLAGPGMTNGVRTAKQNAGCAGRNGNELEDSCAGRHGHVLQDTVLA